jgi:hypothetical protein
MRRLALLTVLLTAGLACVAVSKVRRLREDEPWLFV